MIKYGIIGVSSIAQRFVDGLKLTSEGKAYAVSSRSLDKSKNFAEKNEILVAYDDYNLLINDPNIDVIYVSTTNNTHYQITKLALEAFKHCVVEKPFTLKLEEAKELFELARTNKCFLMEGQKSVFIPTTNKIKEIIDEGIIGKVNYIYLPASIQANWPKDFWMYDLDAGGGAVMGSANYALSFASYLIGEEVVNVHSFGINHPGEADYLSSFSFQFSGGCITNAVLGMEIDLVNRCYIYGELGYIYLDYFWKSKKITLCLKDKEPVVYDLNYQSEFTYYLNHVNKMINEGNLTSNIMSEEMTYTCVKNCEIIYNQYQKELLHQQDR